MKAINLFNILALILNCGPVCCSTEIYQINSIEHLDKENWIENFNSESSDTEKHLFGIEELCLLVKNIENICEMIESVKKNKTERALDEELLKIVRKVDRNSFKNLRYFKCRRLFKGLVKTNDLIKQFLVLFEKKQGENRDTVLNESNENVVNELEDLDNILSNIEEKLFDQEEGESEVSYLNCRINDELENLHFYIQKICHLIQIYTKPQYFNDEEKNLLSNISKDIQTLKRTKEFKDKENFITEAKICHKKIIDVFWKYRLYLIDKKRNLKLIIKTFKKISRCKVKFDTYLEKLISLN
jgi:hypothetical protein